MPDQQPVRMLEQGRAEFAYRCAEEGSKIKQCGEYRQYVKKIPMLIKTNGLGATFAFVKAKRKSNQDESGYAYTLIYRQTADLLCRDEKRLLDIQGDLVEAIISCDSPVYRDVTVEVLAFFNWLSRFAEGLIEKGDKN